MSLARADISKDLLTLDDLTRLARSSRGVFPRDTVGRFVTGDAPRPATSHGTKDMPVWGPAMTAAGLDASAFSSARTTCSWPTSSANVRGRHLRASTW